MLELQLHLWMQLCQPPPLPICTCMYDYMSDFLAMMLILCIFPLFKRVGPINLIYHPLNLFQPTQL